MCVYVHMREYARVCTQVFVLLILALQRSSNTQAKFGVHRDLQAVFHLDDLKGSSYYRRITYTQLCISVS